MVATLRAFVLLGVAATVASAQTIPPRTQRVEVVGDTVRFVISPGRAGGLQFGWYETGTHARFGYVRSSGRWIVMNRQVAPWRARVPDFRLAKSVLLVGNWRLTEDTSRGRIRNAIRSPDGREYVIRPSVDTTTLRAILTRSGDTEASFLSGWSGFSSSPQSWRFDGRTFWMATWGNWAALVAFDTVSRTMKTYANDWVADAVVRGMALTRRAVWLALRMPNGFMGKGLARFDRVTHQWSLIPADWLSDQLILGLSGVGDTVWVAGTDALAAYDDRTSSWDVRWFHATPVVHADTTVDRYGEYDITRSVRARWQLQRERDPHEAATRVIIDAANAIVDGDSIESFLAVARSLPPEHFTDAYQGGSYDDETSTRRTDLAIALAHPRLIRFFLLDTLQEARFADDDVLEAIGTLRDRSLLPYVQWSARQSTGVARREAMAAWALARLGDTTRLSDLRSYATFYDWNGPRNWAADALVELGDTVIVRRVLELVRNEYKVWPVEWLRRHLTADQWADLVRAATTDATLRNVMLLYAYDYADSLMNDSAFRQSLTRWVHAALTTAGREQPSDEVSGDVRRTALFFARRMRDGSAVPLIIPILTTDDDGYDRASTALFQLTAADSVPGSPYSNPAERQLVRAFWERWWRAHQSSFVVADRAAGEAAEAMWWRNAMPRRR